MKQIFAKKGEVVIEEIPPPTCEDNGVLIANVYSVISVGTESLMIGESRENLISRALKNRDLLKKGLKAIKKRGLKSTISTVREMYPQLTPLGYSSAGIVISVGENVIDVNIGDWVACAGAGKANHAEVVAIPRNLVAKIPGGVSFKEAAFATLGSIAMHGIRRAERQFGETIVIVGLGLLGNLALQIARASGYKVIGVDINEDRVKLAEKLGADLALVSTKVDVIEETLKFTQGIGADAVIIYASTPSSDVVNQAMRMIRKKGRIVVVGTVGMNLERQPFYENEADFLISCSYGPGRYDPTYEEKGIDYPIGYVRWTENRNMQAFLEMLKERKVNVEPLIGAEFPIEEANRAYDLIMRVEKRPLTVLLKYDASEYTKYVDGEGRFRFKRLQAIAPGKIEGKIDVAVIGAGRFAKTILLPNIARIPGYNLRAIATASGINAKQTAEKFGAEYCTTDYREVLEDKNIDLVFITTRHNLHYQMILDAAMAQKAIFVEKPLCLTEKQLDGIIKVVSEANVPLVVGFNRRYSSLVVKAKQLLSGKHRPYLISYRVNAGFIPKDSWVQDPEIGGGRIIGECCHFFDLFNYFIGSYIETVRTDGIPINDSTVVANDNIAATIKWRDGSLTTLTYTALGHEDLPKERIEIFADGSCIVIDDFKEMKLYGFKDKDIKLKKQDKGHHQEWVDLAKFLKGQESHIISLEDIMKAMKISFIVEEKLRGK